MEGSPARRKHPRVFVSFSSSDLSFAQALADALQVARISTFFAPRDVLGGSNFAVEITRAIAACDLVVVLLSEASIRSPHVRREVALAIDERRALLPLSLPGTSYPAAFSSEWMYWLSAVQVVEYQGVQPVVARVRQLLNPAKAWDPDRASKQQADSSRQPTALARRSPPHFKSPSSLLRSDHDLIHFEGRQGELIQLEQWCFRDGHFDARVLTGMAGQGKSRLARELMRRMVEAGWETRTLLTDPSESDHRMGQSDARILIVVDYAETRSSDIAAFLDGIVRTQRLGKVRLLLLARTSGDWWKALAARHGSGVELLADATIQPLLTLSHDREFVERLYVRACERFAAELGLPAPRVVAAPLRNFSSILEVLTSALTRVLTGQAVGGGGTERLLLHERRYILSAAKADGITEVDPVDLDRIAATLTLFGAETEEAAVGLIEECVPDSARVTHRRIARLFRRLYPGPSSSIEGIRPDVLAEDLVADALRDHETFLAPLTGRHEGRLSDIQIRRAMATLARGSSRHDALAQAMSELIGKGDEGLLQVAIDVACGIEEPGRLTTALSQAIRERNDLDTQTLLAAIPEETVALAPIAAELASRITSGLSERSELTTEDVQLLMDCSNRLSDAGRAAEAVAAAQIAVDRLSEPELDPTGVRQRGRSLANLSNRLWEIGKLDDSLLPAKEAVAALLGAKAPPAELAAAKNNLAFRLLDGGWPNEAAREADEAEQLCRAAGQYSGDIIKTFGAILNNMSCICLARGDAHGAMLHATSCVDLRRSQALASRDRYLPYVARALANAASAAEGCGKSGQADRFILEACSHYDIVGPHAPLLRFEQAVCVAIGARIHLSRGDWGAARAVAEDATRVLEGIPVDLGALRSRLSGFLRTLVSRADLRQPDELENGNSDLPWLLEYRDL